MGAGLLLLSVGRLTTRKGLRDFVERDVFASRRAELMPLFGARWFVLPNPVYGSWERALVASACTGRERPADCARKQLAEKYSRLRTGP